jgi:hypothetical protein
MHVRTGPETHPTPRTFGKFSCTEVKRPGRGVGGGHPSLSSVEVASGLDVYIRISYYYAWRGMAWDNLYL